MQGAIEISNNSILNVNLGGFGYEEGVIIYQHPENAKISELERPANSNTIFYKYAPKYEFLGKETAVLVLYRGSDGANIGKTDTLSISIIVIK